MPLTDDAPVPRPNQLIDPYGRTVDYLRVSVTDRCDFRCVYCMAEEMTFLPKAELLTLEELEVLCRRFMAAGIRKIRLTGGEPLVRRNIMQLIRALGAEAKAGVLDDHAGGVRKVLDALECRIGVGNVVVGELFTL